MNGVRYESETCRLRLVGQVGDADLESLQDAMEAFERRAEGHLMIDLTAVSHLADSAASYLIEAKAAHDAPGRRMTLIRKLDSPVDVALKAAARRARP